MVARPIHTVHRQTTLWCQ